ncbi:hypothetical protein FP371_25095 [Citrobacter freundii]|uniref:hypothetical protein n=1 Tax=Gammaproteobacteria TaxID=1236 RepID=UPI0005CFA906|nr:MULTISPECIES: hypothetical protein [Gammaproteobacteria]EEA2350812.1 hypothetical protein [Salmonella enterica subsp. enterica serovar Enteritidis]EEC4304740.1 hypothetical protein [Salmonella enterica subsp. enterica serovar Enteritidis]EEN2407453.1 hypothetical protein [Salmonella enterica subsp. enterica serovar Enteritidis]EES8922153.1 hypothetical protein [Escherichia coli]EES9863739.1 hypothetical protein [Escherichia coli]
MAIMSEFDFYQNVIEKHNAVLCFGYNVLFGLDGRSLVVVRSDEVIPVCESSSSVLLNAAFDAFSTWFKEYNDSFEESQAELAAADAASERAISRMFDDCGWMEAAAQDAWEYNKARLDRQSCFYGDI